MLTALAAATVLLTLTVAQAGPVGGPGGMIARIAGSGSGIGSASGPGAASEVGSGSSGTGPGSGSGAGGSHGGAAADQKAGGGGARADGERTPAAGAAEAPRGVGGSGSALADEGGDTARDGPAPAPSRSPLLLGLGLATAARCGPELTSPDGIEAQTCVLTQGEETWGRTYYRNATGGELKAVLTLMAPEGRTVQMHCAVGAQDEPGVCETPRERTRGDLDGYTAVSEFAASPGGGPLLLRSGSNSARAHGN